MRHKTTFQFSQFDIHCPQLIIRINSHLKIGINEYFKNEATKASF